METIKKEKVENPAAFPILDPNGSYYNEGMTLRDYFAAKAMQSLLSNRGNIEYLPAEINRRDRVVSELCKDAFDVADAMLKQRQAIEKAL